MQRDKEMAVSSLRKSVLQRVEQQLRRDQTEENAAIEIERYAIRVDLERELSARRCVRAHEHLRELAKVRCEVQL